MPAENTRAAFFCFNQQIFTGQLKIKKEAAAIKASRETVIKQDFYFLPIIVSRLCRILRQFG
jgi:hypothetical protein